MPTTGHRWTALRTAAVMSTAVAGLIINALPAITGVLARQLGFGPGMLGAFASANYLGSATGALLAIGIMRRVSPRATLVMGLILLLGSSFASAVLGWGSALVMLRVLGGLGSGFTFSACYYVFSLGDRERNTAASLLGQVAFAGMVITLIPSVVHAFGWRGMFVGLGLLVVPCLLLARYFPYCYREEGEALARSATLVASRVVLWLGLVAVALNAVATIAMWTYLERIGAAAGIAEQTIARSLSVCTFFGFLSSALVLAVGERVTGRIPLIVCVILNVIGVAAASSSIPSVYMAAISVFYFSLPVYLSVQFSVIMCRAPSKRFASRYQLAGNVGSFGPAVGGLVAQHFGFPAVRWLAIALTLVSASLLWIGFIPRRSPSQLLGGPLAPNVTPLTVRGEP